MVEIVGLLHNKINKLIAPEPLHSLIHPPTYPHKNPYIKPTGRPSQRRTGIQTLRIPPGV